MLANGTGNHNIRPRWAGDTKMMHSDRSRKRDLVIKWGMKELLTRPEAEVRRDMAELSKKSLPEIEEIVLGERQRNVTRENRIGRIAMKDRKLMELERAVDKAAQTMDFKYDMGLGREVEIADRAYQQALKDLTDYQKTISGRIGMNKKAVVQELVKIAKSLVAEVSVSGIHRDVLEKMKSHPAMGRLHLKDREAWDLVEKFGDELDKLSIGGNENADVAQLRRSYVNFRNSVKQADALQETIDIEMMHSDFEMSDFRELQRELNHCITDMMEKRAKMRSLLQSLSA